MNKLPPKLQEKYDLIKKSYLEKLSDKFDQLSLLKNSLLNGKFDDKDLDDLYKIIHSLAGSSAVFDCKEISDASYNLEEVLKEIINKTVEFNGNSIKRIKELTVEIEKAYNKG